MRCAYGRVHRVNLRGSLCSLKTSCSPPCETYFTRRTAASRAKNERKLIKHKPSKLYPGRSRSSYYALAFSYTYGRAPPPHTQSGTRVSGRHASLRCVCARARQTSRAAYCKHEHTTRPRLTFGRRFVVGHPAVLRGSPRARRSPETRHELAHSVAVPPIGRVTMSEDFPASHPLIRYG